jgi:hypothetical protein
MNSRIALLLVVALHACAPILGHREVDSSRELLRLHVGDSASVNLASIGKEMGMRVVRPGKIEVTGFMRSSNSLIVPWMLQKPDENQVLVVRYHQDGSQDGCVLRMEGDQGQATVVKFMK